MDFEETEFVNFSSDNSESSDTTDIEDHYNDITSSIQPYAFEPMVTVDEITEHNITSFRDDTHESVFSNNSNLSNWCRCNKCHIENREIDRVCCCDLDIPDKETDCITNNEEFERICLYKPYLEVILIGLSRIRGDQLEDTTSNRSYRFAAYTAFTWWVHGKLGRYNRRVIPSCILWAIRGIFPEEGGIYVNFKTSSRD